MRPRMVGCRSITWGPLILALALVPASIARSQETVAVMVDESATATQLLDRLRGQRADNLLEGARIADRLLREFPDRLVRGSDGDANLFRAVRFEVDSLLRRDPELAEAFATIATARADRMLQGGSIDAVHRTALWTPAGLEAALRRSQMDVEAGLGHSALRRLERLDGHRGLADPAARERRNRLIDLARWVAFGKPVVDLGPWPVPERSQSPFEAADRPPEESGPVELWRTPLPESPYERAFRELRRSGRPVPRTADRIVADGSLLVVMPSADEDRLYLNEGHVVRAIDRLSRRERWRTLIDDSGDRGLGAIGDPTFVAAQGDRVVTLAGHALGNQRTGSGRVVCLDRKTGGTRWSTDLSKASRRFGEDSGSDDLFPYGIVSLGPDAAYVLARRVTNRLETIDYLAALDLEGGDLRWLVPLGSCGGVRLGGTRPYAAPVVEGDSVFIAASVGVVARLDAADGSIEWLRREEVPLREGRFSTEAWEISQPLRIGDRLVSIAPDQSTMLELDARSGAVLDRHDLVDIGAGQPRYLLSATLADRRLLLAIGSDVVAYDASDLTRPLWSYASVNEAAVAEDPGVANRNGIRGRVQIAGDLLLVPTGTSLKMLDLASGRIRQSLAWDEAANVLAADGQILLVDKDSVASVMVPETARQRLTVRQQVEPQRPEWPMAIMELEAACGRRDAAVAAAESALAAVERLGDAGERRRLFDQLIEYDVMVRGDVELGRRVRDLLAAVAIEPDQRVLERLSRGDWHADRGEPAEAMEVWQSLLSDATLGRQPVGDEGRIITARIAARERMRELAAQEGDSLLAPAAALADLRVDRLLDSAAAADQLLAVAEEYPLSPAARRARREAAARLERGGRPFDAMLTRVADVRAMIDADRPDVATAAADVIAEIDRFGRPALARALATMLDDGARSEPVLGRNPGVAMEWPGRLVEVAANAGDLDDLVLLAADDEMYRLAVGSDDLEVVWSVPIEDPSPEVLRGGPELLVWQDADRRQPIAMSMDAATGAVLWLNPSISSLFPASRSGENLPENGQRSIPGSTEIWRWDSILPGVVEDLLILVRRNGDVVAVDARDGSTVRWTLEGVTNVVQHVTHGPLGVLIAGLTRGGEDREDVPTVVLVSPDGRLVRRWELDSVLDREIRWIRQTPLGEVLWGTSDGVSWRGLAPGDAAADDRWSLRRPQLRESWQAWTLPGRLIVRERSDRVGTWRSRDGRWVADTTGSRLPDSAVFEQLLLGPDGQAAAIYGDRVLVLDDAGGLLGLDAVHEDRNYLLGGLAEDSVVVLSFEGAGPVTDENGTPRTEFIYAIYRFGLDDGGRQDGPALELRTLGPRFESMWIREGWILLSSPVSTVAIPLK